MDIVLLYCLICGVGCCTIGGVFGLLMGKKSKKLLSVLLAFSSGIMVALAFFNLFPEAILLSNVALFFTSSLLGAVTVLVINDAVDGKLHKLKAIKERESKDYLLQTGIMMIFAMSFLNLTKGLAIGSGELIDRGFSLTVLIGLHNIFESAALCSAMRFGGCKKIVSLILCGITGFTTIIGGAAGFVLGSLSPYLIATILSIAGGAMLYVCFSEMFLRSNAVYSGRLPTMVIILGILFGIFVIKMLF